MAQIRDILAYICKFYPHKEELSKARVTKLIYLADWKHMLIRKKQISEIKWLFNHYGPYVSDVTDTALSDDLFEVISDINHHGATKEVIALKNANYKPRLSNSEREAIQFTLDKTSSLYWNDFIDLVYSTYPIQQSERYDTLDLSLLASEYQKKRQLELT
ncbi:Panacea domain-containing protein [Pseudovibrio sp. FO-BEG1]|uniref:Panacea domain-containing protein n=1 Tax=Pseudovibrio sp. (strain FO-BEG1) TaxID=911045 RepID=UPI0005A2C017|nr:Panacea domain-containing protein [Pseudovibrio sp. FO-BEG1]